MSDILLECNNLRKAFTIRGKQITVLKGVSFSVHPGEIVFITGKSGAGKSILLSLLGGLDQPNSGSVVFEGHPLESLSNEELSRLRCKKIGFIFQNFNLIASWTASENVEAALRHSGMPREIRRAKAIQALADLGLGDRLDNLPAELSIGQQQRVAVARTLVNDPVLILADEPTGDVDPETAQEIVEMLITPVRERSATLVIATHGNFPLDNAHRVLLLRDGIVSLHNKVPRSSR